MRVRFLAVAAAVSALSLTSGVGCAPHHAHHHDHPAPKTDTTKSLDLVDETITVACGSCVFHMKVKGCPWAAKLGDSYHLIEGAVPSEKDHDAHASDGMCSIPRKAVVTGKLRDGVLTVTKMQLLGPQEAPES